VPTGGATDMPLHSLRSTVIDFVPCSIQRGWPTAGGEWAEPRTPLAAQYSPPCRDAAGLAIAVAMPELLITARHREHAYEVHAYKMHAYERGTPMRCTFLSLAPPTPPAVNIMRTEVRSLAPKL
jgi:hypothetical protein